jgi:hypothetical protein
MWRPIKQFELSGQHRDTQVSFGAREVRLKRLLTSQFKKLLRNKGLVAKPRLPRSASVSYLFARSSRLARVSLDR